ncbi:MAG: anaerobic ribonucleoside-triphosphate reductase, partial [Sphaerochaeta sp.]
MQKQVVKRDGQVVLCEVQKIINAINKAATAAHQDVDAIKVAALVLANMKDVNPITVEQIQDLVEQALMDSGAKETAKAYILYRSQRERVREGNALIKATNALFDSYLNQTTWQTKENANTRRSVNGMNNFIRERFTEQYWLNEIYPKEIKAAHESGAFHL